MTDTMYGMMPARSTLFYLQVAKAMIECVFKDRGIEKLMDADAAGDLAANVVTRLFVPGVQLSVVTDSETPEEMGKKMFEEHREIPPDEGGEVGFEAITEWAVATIKEYMR